jgi:hypothetical protein
MAYPVVNAPYGLKPINLIGGQVFAGSTREYPIPYGYSTNIFYGDLVGLSRGNVARLAVSTGTLGTVTGVFLGCSYTNPTNKQKTFAQYWPASTLAGDAVAIVCDDPDTVFKAVVCSSGTTVASGARAMIGQNLAMINNATGNVNTGDSSNALLAPTNTPDTTDALPIRVLGLVPDTVVTLGSATYTSISTATVTCSALPFALPVGTDVGSLASNGQYIPSGSFVDTAASAGATSFILNQAPVAAFAASSTIVFAQYPELLVKLNFGQHQYYAATSIA